MITFIHIGKCGGSTIKRTLIDNAVKFRHIHLKRPEHEPDSKYLIALRNPVERFISAFYWRRFLLLSGQEAGGKELEFYKEYKDLNNLCEHLFDENSNLNPLIDSKIHQHYTCGHPSHVGMGIDYYIGGITRELTPKNVFGAICTETLSQDMKRLFDVEVTRHARKNSANKLETTQQSRFLLKKYLAKDYQCIDKLYLSNILSEEQYEILKT
ncbi:MAG: hypothetical protein CMO74_14625 [Verrucomicrobiales bacterium]|nr:hypothetical protein [Verrucomicrobiales bacterium]|tara:strand:- start:9928 stop:10563 length:636 start_codon:yes stop_codon:yes gene_type:complete